MTKENLKSSNDELFDMLAMSNMGTFALKQSCDRYVASSFELVDAASLVGNDDIKADMVKHLYFEFTKIQSREDCLKLMLSTYERNAVINEMDAITDMNKELTRKFKERLGDI